MEIDEEMYNKLIKICNLKKQNLQKLIKDDLTGLINYYQEELNSLGLNL